MIKFDCKCWIETHSRNLINPFSTSFFVFFHDLTSFSSEFAKNDIALDLNYMDYVTHSFANEMYRFNIFLCLLAPMFNRGLDSLLAELIEFFRMITHSEINLILGLQTKQLSDVSLISQWCQYYARMTSALLHSHEYWHNVSLISGWCHTDIMSKFFRIVIFFLNLVTAWYHFAIRLILFWPQASLAQFQLICREVRNLLLRYARRQGLVLWYIVFLLVLWQIKRFCWPGPQIVICQDLSISRIYLSKKLPNFY